jgi:hypothetical protein
MAWLLGAGTSVMSGLPSAGDLMRQFRHLLFCTETNQALQDVDDRDPRVHERILAWFRERADLPQPGDEDEYAALFEHAYPSQPDRAAHIRTMVRAGRPNYGHQVLAALMATDLARVVWTTNFDDLPDQAARSLLDSPIVEPRRPLVVAALESAEVATRAMRDESWPLIGKIHGDFQSDRLMNTTQELQAQDRLMRRAMLESCRRFGLIVVGYSGRDASVMKTLRDALDSDNPYPFGLYWCHRPGSPLAPVVFELLAAARDRRVEAHTVVVDNFIELLGALERASFLQAPVRAWLSDRRPAPPTVSTPAPPLGLPDGWPAVRFNALRLREFPTEAMLLHRVGLKAGDASAPEPRLEEILAALRRARARGLVAARSGGQLVALGDRASLDAALADLGLAVSDDRLKLSLSNDAADVDSADVGLAYDGLTIALGRTNGLRHVLRANGEHLVRVDDADHGAVAALRAAAGGTLAGTIPGTRLRWAEAVGISLDQREGQWWLLLSPEIWVAPRPDDVGDSQPTREEIAERKRRAQDFIRERAATRYNRTTAALLDAWVRLLTARGNREVRAWNMAPDAGIDAVFTIGGTTAWSRPLRMPIPNDQRVIE